MVQRLHKLFPFTNQDQKNVAQIIDRYLYYLQLIVFEKLLYSRLYSYIKINDELNLQANMDFEKGHLPKQLSMKYLTTISIC